MTATEIDSTSYEQGDVWNDTDAVVTVEVARRLDKVIPVRLSAQAWESLRREAGELGVGPTTLARMWLLERLRTTRPGTSAPLRTPRRFTARPAPPAPRRRPQRVQVDGVSPGQKRTLAAPRDRHDDNMTTI